MARGCSALVLLALVSSPLAVRGADAPGETAPALRWMTASGARWELSPSVPRADDVVIELRAPPWFRVLPDVEIPLLDGGVFDVGSARGRIVLLDFWASWCAPCLKELPRLQELYDRESTRGLAAVAVNAQESDELVRTAVESLKLTLPIGKLTKTLNRELQISSLPTVVIADREGRVRARWDGYPKDLEAAIAKRVGELLADDSVGEAIPIAEMLVGAERIRVAWRREVGVSARGLALIRLPDGNPRIYLSEPGRIWTLAADGRILDRFTVPPESGRLVQGDFDGDGAEEMVAFRPGSEHLVLIDPETGRHRQWDAPAPVDDVAVAPTSGEHPAGLVLATRSGLFISGVEDAAPRRLGPSSPQAAVVVPAAGAAAVALAVDETVGWYQADGTAAARVPAGSGWKLVIDRVAEGVGVLRLGTIAAVAGDLLGSGGREVAVASAEGELLILDAASGETRVRARWPGITDLMVRDLDGDGVDELFVAENRALTVLEAP